MSDNAWIRDLSDSIVQGLRDSGFAVWWKRNPYGKSQYLYVSQVFSEEQIADNRYQLQAGWTAEQRISHLRVSDHNPGSRVHLDVTVTARQDGHVHLLGTSILKPSPLNTEISAWLHSFLHMPSVTLSPAA